MPDQPSETPQTPDPTGDPFPPEPQVPCDVPAEDEEEDDELV